MLWFQAVMKRSIAPSFSALAVYRSWDASDASFVREPLQNRKGFERCTVGVSLSGICETFFGAPSASRDENAILPVLPVSLMRGKRRRVSSIMEYSLVGLCLPSPSLLLPGKERRWSGSRRSPLTSSS